MCGALLSGRGGVLDRARARLRCGRRACGRWVRVRRPRPTSGGAGIRGIVTRRTGTPFIRAVGSSSRCATSAADTRRAERWDQRSERAREPAAVQPLADDHPAAVKAVLPAPGLDGGGDRLARLAAVGGDDGLEPEQAAVLGALGGAHLRPVERRPQAALGQPPAFLAHELVLVAAVQAPRELLEERRGGGQLEADDRRLAEPRSARGRSARAAGTPAPRRRRSASRRSCAPCETASRTRARAARRRVAGAARRGRGRGARPGRRR